MNNISWIASARRDDEVKLRLFCFPFAGGGSSYYQSWRGLVHHDIDLCPVMLPGREKLIRQTPHADIRQLCDLLVDKIEPFTHIPYAFFGHSMGALIAYELTQALTRRHSTLPLHLFLSAFPAPGHISRREPIHDLDEGAFKQAIASFNGTPREVLEDAALMAVMLPYLRADFKMIETYHYQNLSPVAVPISVYGGSQDHILRSDLLKWKFETSLSCQVHIFDGGHFYLNDSTEMNMLMNRELARLITQVEVVQHES